MSGQRMPSRLLLIALATLVTLMGLPLAAATPKPAIRVTCKPFTESYLLSEMAAQLIEDSGEAPVERRFGIGSPHLVMEALRTGNVDVDINYTGSLALLFLKEKRNVRVDELQAVLSASGITLSKPLGFNNTYAIAVTAGTARRFNLRRISDLRGHPELRGAFTPDFLDTDDGYYKLAEFYGFKLNAPRPMQHSLAYRALASGEIDLTDAYTTDGTIGQFELVLLEDDRSFFPEYQAVLTVRTELTERFPRSWAALRRLEGKLSEQEMIKLNARVDNKQGSVKEVARSFLVAKGLVASADRKPILAAIDENLWVATYEHFVLVLASLVISTLVGVPLGIFAFHRRRFGHLLIATAGLLQTIPSLALLCFLIPLLGIGALPTICALFIYGLLPIVQSTTSGLLALDPRLVETAKVLGLTRWQQLRLVALPLASINILAGIKTTAVLNVATATIAAFIGAGGYGRYITSGLALNDNSTILKGAIPTALMALGFHALFELLDRILVPKGLRT